MNAQAESDLKIIAKEDDRLGRVIAPLALIMDIHITSFSCNRFPLMDELKGKKVSVLGSNRLNASCDFNTKRWFAQVEASVKICDGNEPTDSNTAVDIAVQYQITYSAPNWEGTLDEFERATGVFCLKNSVMHIWSAWRNLVLTSSSQMGINPILIPLMFSPRLKVEETGESVRALDQSKIQQTK